MADNEEDEEPTSRGHEWEVVSLSASAYAAAPGPKQENQDDRAYTHKEYDAETSNAMFMSGHFVFPPSQHENLPLEQDGIEVKREYIDDDDVSDFYMKEGDTCGDMDEEDCDIQGRSGADVFPVLYTDDEDRNKLSLQDARESSKCSKEEVYDGSKSNLPCEAWWKRRAGCFYAHAKDANTLWSIFIAATMMGLVILGQHWQQERWQKMGKMMGPIYRLKDVVVGGHRRGSFIRASTSGEH